MPGTEMSGEGMQCCEAGIACSYAISALGFEVVEKALDSFGSEVCDAERFKASPGIARCELHP
ncbi:hypothetical protein WS63_03330 [Burkholderia stagnalis]|nr:hypothetical protein WS63_03330 [Burkholderia stagnalis]